jgi:hypothetical protein
LNLTTRGEGLAGAQKQLPSCSSDGLQIEIPDGRQTCVAMHPGDAPEIVTG